MLVVFVVCLLYLLLCFVIVVDLIMLFAIFGLFCALVSMDFGCLAVCLFVVIVLFFVSY